MTCTLAGHLKGSGSSEFSGHDSARAEESRIYLVLGYILQSVIAAVTPVLLTCVFAHLLVTVSNERRKVMNQVAESQLLGSQSNKKKNQCERLYASLGDKET